ncbi:DNA methyltransferase [Enterobacter hormaechei]|uniref:DNA methyltransferase n=1 Tax=Enterobacter hormaechei TaxID=158836 RepID=UPI001C18DAF5|nr:site-specific DNA-methyltransferase [Enterobacter hormaechei subsp. xiangfangensis]HAV1617302.1 site-specific DNA-methyltransferase [Enterobacter hormaechei subsp. xiangfangensis]
MQQNSLFSSNNSQQTQTSCPVTCLGKTFANDQARREYFLALLAEKLKDPEFRKIDGFPLGNDKRIMELSDPPYYTACPNPFLDDLISHCGSGSDADAPYDIKPLSLDVKDVKSHAIYNAHTYHTKVPHRAIMKYLLHYTKPGDVVLDAFCGTGMTGVAAAACGDTNEIQSLNLKINNNKAIDSNGNEYILGSRNAILFDLSPIATFISYNLNNMPAASELNDAANILLNKVANIEKELYSSFDESGSFRGLINYSVWSDVYICGDCSFEYSYWSQAVELGSGEAKKIFPCPNCGAQQNTRNLTRSFESSFDYILKKTIKMPKQTPVLINYYDNNGKKKKTTPTVNDIHLASSSLSFDDVIKFINTVELPKGDRYKRDAFEGRNVTHVHHFYTWRNLKAIYSLISNIESSHFNDRIKKALLFVVTSFADRNGTKRNRFVINDHNPNGRVNGPMANTFYLPNLFCEMNIFELFREKLKDILSACDVIVKDKVSFIGTSSAKKLTVPDNSVDYIFTDPPFGSNIQYSELNQPLESIVGLFSKSVDDIVVNEVLNKDVHFYKNGIRHAFTEYYRVLKPGRWITVEFSNTKAGIWNSLQTALTEAGFVIATVTALDKSRGGMHSMIGVTAVKQDLVITAYKPSGDFENTIISDSGDTNSVWKFISMHLNHIPITRVNGNSLEFITERDPRILFDRMVALFVQKNMAIPMSSQEFHLYLNSKFIERDGMYFLPEQAAEYDRKKSSIGKLTQASLFVKDEASAIDWLRQQLKDKPLIFSDINPQFMQQLSSWSKNEVVLDLRELLNQNFLCYDGQDKVPDQIHSYLSSNWKELRNLEKNDPNLIAKAKDRWYVPDPNKAGDLEKLREKSLLKEFEDYKDTKKKLKVFRIEAVRIGFKKLWELQEFATLIAVADKLPNNVLEEDPILLMYYDQAITLSQPDTNDEW